MVQTERETGALRGQFARQVAVQASAAAQAESARAQAEQLSRKLGFWMKFLRCRIKLMQ